MLLKSNFIVERFQPDLAGQWDSFVRSSRTPLFLFERSYMDYHAHRFEDYSLVVRETDRIVALLPANRTGDTITSHGGLTYGGLITGTQLHASATLSAFDAIAEYCRADGLARMVYKVVPGVFKNYPADEDVYALTRCGATLMRRDLSSVIALANKPKLSDSRKSTARKPLKLGAEFCELADFDKFHALLVHVLSKFAASPVHSLEEMRLLKFRFPAQIRLFGVMLEGTLLAGGLVYEYDHIVHTQYLASSDEGRKIGALDCLLIKLMEEVFPAKQYFSFGISTEDNGRFLNDGLIRQKEGFGGRGIVHDFYEWIF